MPSLFRTRWRRALVALMLLLPVERATAGEAELDGREVMEQVDARPRGGDQVARASWRLIDRKGRERVRETRLFWRDYRREPGGIKAKRLIVFESPAQLRDTAFLVWSRIDSHADDDRWIYLPALRKVRRIAGRDRGKSFVGSDFNYDDLSDHSVDEDEHRLVRSEMLGDAKHYVVESTPKDARSPYEKRIQWVDATTFTQSRIEYYGPEGLLKVLEASWQQVQGVWAWQRLEMRTEASGHHTVIEVSEVQHGTGLAEDLFQESALRLGAF